VTEQILWVEREPHRQPERHPVGWAAGRRAHLLRPGRSRFAAVGVLGHAASVT